MRCDSCGSALRLATAESLCPLCAIACGAPLSASRADGSSVLWLWSAPDVKRVLATKDLGLILKAYRSTTGISQRRVADDLGYDATYISMIESGRRRISDIGTLRNFARYLGMPPHVFGVTDDDADFNSMLRFGESTVRLAAVARQAGRAAEAVNELWPLVSQLDTRAQTEIDRRAALLLAKARAELGVALGDVLPEERLASAARSTGRAVRLAQRLDDADLLAYTLRVHGNELRKVDHHRAALIHLQHARQIVTDPGERASTLMQLARAAGDVGDATTFNDALDAAWRHTAEMPAPSGVTPFVLGEVKMRGYASTGRLDAAVQLIDDAPREGSFPPQWRVIERTTVGTVWLLRGDLPAAQQVLHEAIRGAQTLRLPHQMQRAVRAARGKLDEIADVGSAALDAFWRKPPLGDH